MTPDGKTIIIAFGGGGFSKDRKLRFFDVKAQKEVDCLDDTRPGERKALEKSHRIIILYFSQYIISCCESG